MYIYTFKERYGNHKQSFKSEKYKAQTTLSTHVWKLKQEDIPHSIQYKLICKAKPYNPSSKFCNLCNGEKTIIITQPNKSTLNKRTELTAKCRHREPYLLKNYKPG